METKNLQEFFNETKELNTKYLVQDAFGNTIKIFGYVPANENTGLECSAISNDHIFLSRFESLPIYGNLKVLDKDEKLPLKQTYVSELSKNKNYLAYINSTTKNKLEAKNLENVSVEKEVPIYNAKEGDLFFWKDQECILKKYGISKAFLVVGYYMYEGSYKYIFTNPSELFLIENETKK